MMEKAGIASSDRARKFAEELYQRAKQHLRNKRFDTAIKCYDKAIATPSLSAVHQSTAFEKRAECYLEWALANNTQAKDEKESKIICKRAMLDATEALKLNKKSWNAHFTLGRNTRFFNLAHFNQNLFLKTILKNADCAASYFTPNLIYYWWYNLQFITKANDPYMKCLNIYPVNFLGVPGTCI